MNLAPTEKQRRLKQLTLRVKIAYLTLMAFIIIWHGLLSDLALDKRLVFIALWLTPMLLLSRGVFKNKGKTAVWLTIMSLIYIGHGLMTLLEPSRRFLAILELMLAINLYWQAFVYGKQAGFRKNKSKKK